MNVDELRKKAKQVRRDIIEMLAESGSGHPGGSLSMADILTVLYFNKMRYDSKKPDWPDRDRFVLSKGHAAPALYAILAETGYFPKKELMTLRKIGSHLQGHPAYHKTSGVEASTGSLGTGLSQACGMALAAKLDKKDCRIYSLVGDGECDEGQIWEAAMSAAHYELDNLCVFLDRNCIQLDGFTKDIMCLGDLEAKWKAFGWNVIEIDGHDIEQIIKALDDAEKIKGKPTMIVAKTVKGKGVSFMENNPDWHGRAPTQEEAKKALEELR